MRKFAAIDIGSNAMRLLVMSVYDGADKPVYIKSSLVRVPVRLGQEAFTDKMVSEETQRRLLHGMKSYYHFMHASQVVAYRGVGTSALRTAENGAEIVQRIREEAGIDIRMISGAEEAEIIHSTQVANLISDHKSYLYVDVGGGSTELTIYSQNQQQKSRSFKIGTIRLLNDTITGQQWESLKKWLEPLQREYPDLTIIGSGGNINKLFKLAYKKPNKPLTHSYLKKRYRELSNMSYEDRIFNFSLNADRADVIVPATEIFLKILEFSGCNEVYVPKIGLADGLVRRVYSDYKRKKLKQINILHP
jgi:exopolyphosphatase/guanosine-5'-triphosphate,3'-diphosphate pyrophosphatase